MIKYLLGITSQQRFRYFIVECNEKWDEEKKGFVITRHYGQVRGKDCQSPDIVVKRTCQNRTWKEQYTLQFNSEVKKQLDKGYIETEKHPNEYSDSELKEMFGSEKTNQSGVIKPQLAKQIDKVTNLEILEQPWFISRKFDGLKALFYYKDGEVHAASRGGTNYDISVTHLRANEELIKFFEEYPSITLDGELFKRGRSLQEISGAARKDEIAYWLEYWIYDMYDSNNPDMTAEARINFMNTVLACDYNIPVYYEIEDDEYSSPIRLLNHSIVTGKEEMMKFHDKWVEEGFEGAVITDLSKPYKPGSRCNNLIKIKKYKSKEFKVIDYKLGLRGSEDMTFTCQLEDGRTFEAMPVGNREIKQEYVDNFEAKYKNHLAECTYFNFSNDGIPTQPKLRVFRFDLE